MKGFSERVANLNESVTLKLNAKATKMAESGTKIYNLTAGQLPFRPMKDFIDQIQGQLDFLKSFHYSPVAGFPELTEKWLDHFEKTRNLDSLSRDEFGAICSNGGKHSISNVFASLINPGDEAIMIAPYWVSYPEMIELYGGVPRVVESTFFEGYVPPIHAIEELINEKTKMIIINSPNNPAGIHYPDPWMKELATLLRKYPDVFVLSDEIYFQLYYYDPKPTYFYQHDQELLKRTIIIEGISKTLSSTGLRHGVTIANKEIIKVLTKIQGQTASGTNSLVQRALIEFDFDKIEEYLEPIKGHLRENAELLREALRTHDLGKCWYQTSSAFYFFLDFSQAPILGEGETEDKSFEICEEILEQKGLAIVPGGAFGVKNAARLSLVSPKDVFEQAVKLLIQYLTNK